MKKVTRQFNVYELYTFCYKVSFQVQNIFGGYPMLIQRFR